MSRAPSPSSVSWNVTPASVWLPLFVACIFQVSVSPTLASPVETVDGETAFDTNIDEVADGVTVALDEDVTVRPNSSVAVTVAVFSIGLLLTSSRVSV